MCFAEDCLRLCEVTVYKAGSDKADAEPILQDKFWGCGTPAWKYNQLN